MAVMPNVELTLSEALMKAGLRKHDKAGEDETKVKFDLSLCSRISTKGRIEARKVAGLLLSRKLFMSMRPEYFSKSLLKGF